jgi:lipoprotein-releasing system permease protein
MVGVSTSVGLRYAFSRRSSISFIGFVAIAGLALSVAVLVIVISVINGFERELEQRVFGVLPHVNLHARQPITDDPQARSALVEIPGISAAAPFILGGGLLAVPEKVQGIVITGVDPASVTSVSDLDGFIVAGRGAAELQPRKYEVILGWQLARQMNVEVGDKVTVVLPVASITPAGLFPRQKRFTVAGVFRSRSDVDQRNVYLHIADAQRLFRLSGGIHGYQLKLDDLFQVSQPVAGAIEALAPDRYTVRSWMRTHGNLYQAIAMQKLTMFVLLSFLVGVAAFNLVSTLIMVVEQRSGDVAVLRTMGGGSAMIVKTFVLLGVLIGSMGIALGVLVGVLVAMGLPGFYAWVTRTFDVELMSQYFVNYLPSQVLYSDILGIAITAFVICAGATIYPAWRASRQSPSRVLAHE